MDQIRATLRRARLRLMMRRFLAALPWSAAIAIFAAATALLAERLLAASMPWTWLSAGLGVAAFVGAIVWAAAKTPGPLRAAQAVDQGADLRESLSTAMCVADRDDAWSRAAVDDAARRASLVDLRRALPWRRPRAWPAPIVAAGALAAAWLFTPHTDLLGRAEASQKQQQQEEELAQARSEAEAVEDKLDELLAEAGVEQDEAGTDELTPRNNATPDDIRRAAIRKLTNARDRIEKMRNSEKAQRLDAVRDRLRRLRQPGAGPLNDLVSAMQRGDFREAADRLAELSEKIAAGDLSEQDKAKLREQLNKLAEQMREQARRNDRLKDALRQAGIDPSKADDPQALKEAIENAEGLSDQQKQELMRLAQGAGQARENLQQMAGALQQAGQAGQMNNQGLAAMDDLAGQLSDLEMLQQEMEAAEAAEQFTWGQVENLAQCLGQPPGQPSMFRLWDEGAMNRGPGGGQLTSSDAPFKTQKKKASSPTQPGPIVGSRYVQGEQVRGESRQGFAEAVEVGESAAADAIENKQTPREYHDALKHYFGRLKAKAEAERMPSDEQTEETTGESNSR